MRQLANPRPVSSPTGVLHDALVYFATLELLPAHSVTTGADVGRTAADMSVIDQIKLLWSHNFGSIREVMEGFCRSAALRKEARRLLTPAAIGAYGNSVLDRCIELPTDLAETVFEILSLMPTRDWFFGIDLDRHPEAAKGCRLYRRGVITWAEFLVMCWHPYVAELQAAISGYTEFRLRSGVPSMLWGTEPTFEIKREGYQVVHCRRTTGLADRLTGFGLQKESIAWLDGDEDAELTPILEIYDDHVDLLADVLAFTPCSLRNTNWDNPLWFHFRECCSAPPELRADFLRGLLREYVVLHGIGRCESNWKLQILEEEGRLRRRGFQMPSGLCELYADAYAIQHFQNRDRIHPGGCQYVRAPAIDGAALDSCLDERRIFLARALVERDPADYLNTVLERLESRLSDSPGDLSWFKNEAVKAQAELTPRSPEWN